MTTFFKIKNDDWTKSGWSYGKSRDKTGNTNWLNHKTGRDFDKPESAKNQFWVGRPTFTAGSGWNKPEGDTNISKLNRRNGLGNRDITRENYDAAEIAPRQVLDFNKLQAIDIEQFGQKVQLSDKTLKSMFEVLVPDPTDTEWLAEENRMTIALRAQGMSDADIKRELEINKPLGREQRKIKKTENIAQSSLSNKSKLDEIEQEIREGRAESRTQQATLLGQLALILNDVGTVSALTAAETQTIIRMLAQLGANVNHKRLGITPDYVDIQFYNQNAGMINLYLFSRVINEPQTQQYNYDLLVKNFANNPNTGLPAMKLVSAISAMGRQGNKRLYLDLERGGLLNLAQLRALATHLGGFDNNPKFSIEPQFR